MANTNLEKWLNGHFLGRQIQKGRYTIRMVSRNISSIQLIGHHFDKYKGYMLNLFFPKPATGSFKKN